MNTELREPLKTEIERLERILNSVEKPFKKCPGASEEQVATLESDVGIRFDEHLRDLWKFSNGGITLVAETDEITRCRFAPITKAREAWAWSLPYEQMAHQLWRNGYRDARIKPAILHHRLWFPIAEFNGFSTAVHFDSDPTPTGKYGQIIAYQHDPDAIYYLAEDFISFVTKSNDLLEANLTQLLFMEDEFERICHMKGLNELERQLAEGLDPFTLNWQKLTLSAFAEKKGRIDIVDYLKNQYPR